MRTSHFDSPDFDHPFRVLADGTIGEAPGVYAPDLLNEELSPSGVWEMLNGYSGQDSYSGPIMHNSEYIGGQLERDILAQPGVYVLVAAYWDREEDDDREEMLIEGWAICRLIESEKPMD